MSHLLVDIFFEFSVVENFFGARITIIHTSEVFGSMSRHERKTSSVSKKIRVCLTLCVPTSGVPINDLTVHIHEKS